jgi:hypothetical protein
VKKESCCFYRLPNAPYPTDALIAGNPVVYLPVVIWRLNNRGPAAATGLQAAYAGVSQQRPPNDWTFRNGLAPLAVLPVGYFWYSPRSPT